jgi:MipA family protein
MNKLASLLWFTLMLGHLASTAWAQDRKTSLVPLPSVEDFSKGKDGWSFGLGLSIEYESAYEGSDEFGFEVDPAGAVQWRKGNDVFFWAGEALGWRGLRAGTWLFEAVVGFDEGRKEKDSKKGRLNGLGDGRERAQFALQVRHALGLDWRHWLIGRVVTGGQGNLGLFGVGRRFGDKNDGTGSEVNLVVVFHDRRYANTDFGITAQQSSASGLSETRLGGGFRSLGVNYTYRHDINQNWQLFGEAVYERFSSRVRASPIARSSHEAEIGVGLLYRF